MLRRTAVLLLFVAVATAAAPASSQMPPIAAGVSVGGVQVGVLTSEPARATLAKAFSRSIPVVQGKRRWWASPQRLGAGAAIDDAVSRALAAAPRSALELDVTYSPAAVEKFVAHVAKRFDRAPVDARLAGLGPSGPEIDKERWGIAVRRHALAQRLIHALDASSREPVKLPTRLLRPETTAATFGPIVVIWRGSNVLRLYNGTGPVATFNVATGTSQYPTPSGTFAIVDKQLNPWWRPPNSDWARGLDPVPPGPDNPLGTRWMGLTAPGVGIHGTPSAASIGYSASHGCIRMRIPEAEWLFNQVSYGTPVIIV